MDLYDLSRWAFETSKEKGFWDLPHGSILAEKVALMHSELSELLEVLRKDPKAPSEKIPYFTVEEEELADLFIRAGDYAHAQGLRIEEAILAKMEYNSERVPMHGKNF